VRDAIRAPCGVANARDAARHRCALRLAVHTVSRTANSSVFSELVPGGIRSARHRDCGGGWRGLLLHLDARRLASSIRSPGLAWLRLSVFRPASCPCYSRIASMKRLSRWYLSGTEFDHRGGGSAHEGQQTSPPTARVVPPCLFTECLKE